MPGQVFKLLCIIPGALAIVFALGAMGLLGNEARVNGGTIFFVFGLSYVARWLWREGDKRDRV